MKKIIITLILIQLMIIPAIAFSGSGSGTESDPYQITDVDELQEMENDLTANYTLMNDINASDTVNWNSGAGFEPVGNHGNGFNGTFDGQNFIINNLYIDRITEEDVSLFGYFDSGLISNVGLKNVNITGEEDTGGLVGHNIGGTINNSYSTGNVIGDNVATGGLIGHNKGTKLNNSYSTCSVSGGFSQTGGLVGFNDCTITNSYSTGNVIGDDYATGGFIGHNTGGTITNSYSTGNVIGDNYGTGGLIGYNYGSTTINSYSIGSVTGDTKTGGLIGFNRGTISNSYSTGNVTGNTDAGGLIGYNDDTVDDSYWNIDTSGQTISDGGTGLTTSEMQDQSNFNNWDFTNTWNIYTNNNIQGELNNGTPYIKDVTPNGELTLDDKIIKINKNPKHITIPFILSNNELRTKIESTENIDKITLLIKNIDGEYELDINNDKNEIIKGDGELKYNLTNIKSDKLYRIDISENKGEVTISSSNDKLDTEPINEEDKTMDKTIKENFESNIPKDSIDSKTLVFGGVFIILTIIGFLIYKRN